MWVVMYTPCIDYILWIHVLFIDCVPGEMGADACDVFPESLTLREVRSALWNARVQWESLGVELGLPMETLQVIEGYSVSYSALYMAV